MSLYLIEMIELFFIIYYIPKTMTRLAREHKRSAAVWSLIGIGAWLAGEFIVVMIFGAIYVLGIALRGWSDDFSAGLQLFVYVAAFAAAGGSLMLVERILTSRARDKSYPPPLPPEF